MFETISSKVVDSNRLPALKKDHPRDKIVFCTGCFDIIQSGHAVFFSQCRQFGSILVVGVGRDSTLRALKGPDRPINPEANRVHLVAAMQDVDYAVLNDEKIIEGKIDFKDVLTALRPDVFVLNDDDSSIPEKQKLCDELGIELAFVERTVPPALQPTSTTNIINKINFSLKAPLRIDFAGGWTDVPYIMNGKPGYVSNIAIKPLIELKAGKFNFSGYPRGSGLSTSTAVKLLEMLNSKSYNAEPKTLEHIGEDLFNLENKELQWFIGRQDQYAVVFGGFNCFEFGADYARPAVEPIDKSILEVFRKHLLLIHTGESRNAQSAVEEVYRNYKTASGQQAIEALTRCGRGFAMSLMEQDFDRCAEIISENWEAQKALAPSSSNDKLDMMYTFAMDHGAKGGKLCGAGGGGAFLFVADNPEQLKKNMKKQFVGCFEVDFEFEYRNIKKLNNI